MSIPSSQVRPTNGAALAFDCFAGLFGLGALVALSGAWPDGAGPTGVATAAVTFGALVTPAVLCAGFSAILRRISRR